MSLSISEITKLDKQRAFGEDQEKSANENEVVQPKYESKSGKVLRKLASNLKSLNLSPYVEEGIQKALNGEFETKKEAASQLDLESATKSQDKIRLIADALLTSSKNMKIAAYNKGAALVKAQAGMSQLNTLLGD